MTASALSRSRIMPLLDHKILKSAKLCDKDANLCATDAKWVTGILGVLGLLAGQRLLKHQASGVRWRVNLSPPHNLTTALKFD